jgi:putative flavoprotein involved in K+ transport
VRTIDTVVIGAGQAGLAVSRCLTDRGRDHVVLDRGRIGERWRSETWDSLHLLSPNWINTLPGEVYRGPDPDGFAAASDHVRHLDTYAASFGAPVEEHTAVRRVSRKAGRFEIATDNSVWRAHNVVVATGWCDRPAVPAVARDLAPDVNQVVPRDYRNPAGLPDGGVLVVGASATGVQIAEELRASGREVTLAVGSHTRLPRRYRGRDIYWWMHRIGMLDKTIDEMPDRGRALREPSAQLIGGPDPRPLDLSVLQANGVRLTGRVTAANGHRVRTATDLSATVAAADRRLHRLLGAIDRHLGTPAQHPHVTVQAGGLPEIDLRAEGFRTVVWATGHRRSYPWLRLPVLNLYGEIRHHRGRTPVPGLYVIGQRFQQRRNSNSIGGVGQDAEHVAHHLMIRRTTKCLCTTSW